MTRLIRRAARRKPAGDIINRRAYAAPLAFLFIAIALLTLPLFAHGCHRDDDDHEPLFIPLRLNAEE